ncbi:hypothetical protein [Alkalihalobacterium sp. APHAB7]|uniref:hypothetical protein n=1 Tax=Alkalihalobacterium sp. APHAB7 TaxID=3402081 RepID=UPI003AAA2912
MKISSSYPYPVLYVNNDDYTSSSFTAAINVDESFGEVRIYVDFYLDNRGISRLIEAQSAVYLVHIECPQTSFRKAYETNENKIEIVIPSDVLRGKILIHTFVIAKETIEHYTNVLLNKWFKELPVRFEKGNFIAIGEAIEMNLFEDHTEFLNLPSIITVTKSLKKEYMDVDIHSNNISILLPEYEYNQYATTANSRLKNTILSTVIVPALVYVFSKLRDSRGELDEYTWYQVLDKIFAENNYRLEDVGTDSLSPLQAAQLVLRKPLRASFEEIEKLNRTED